MRTFAKIIPSVRHIFFSCLCLAQGSLPAEVAGDEGLGKRVHAHMVIGDYTAACSEAFVGLQSHPDSKILWQAYLRALAKAGDEKVLMVNWRLFVKKFPGESCNREMLECLAWAVLENGAVLPLRVSALFLCSAPILARMPKALFCCDRG